jgi:hypothetical protein
MAVRGFLLCQWLLTFINATSSKIMDPTTRCIVYETEVHELDKFCAVIDLDRADVDPGASYEIEARQLSRIAAAFDIPCEGIGGEGLRHTRCVRSQDFGDTLAGCFFAKSRS